jgi:hypothetical protein
VTQEELQTFFQTLADRYFSGDISDLSDVHAYPYSVYLDGNYRIEKSPEVSERNIARRREDFRALGASRMLSRLDSIQERSDGRFSALLTLTLLGPDAEPLGHGQTTYLCRYKGTGELLLEGCEIVGRTVPAMIGNSIQVH